MGSAGTQTAALAFGGVAVASCSNTESYNGTSWTAGGVLTTARNFLRGAGTNTAALAFGGNTTSPVFVACTESYNGTSWTAGGVMNTARASHGGVGASNTAALAFGGSTSATVVIGTTESYNGSTWTNLPASLNLSKSFCSFSFGSQTSALGGNTGNSIESWNGISWSSKAGLTVSRTLISGLGTSNMSGLGFGSYSPTTTCTETWNGTTWSSRGAMNVARGGAGAAGSQSAGLGFGGYITPGVTCVESWTITGALKCITAV